MRCGMIGWLICLLLAATVQAQQLPRGQDRPPNPPRSPQEAVQKMTVPPGFHVEVVASEPDIVNPVAMTFDERGRIWITESLEYPRREPGKGRDRIKVLEDTDGDGKIDKVTIFAEGLNIPSGIAVGYGGVWVANAPDILFLRDTDGDGRADESKVVVTGFGRTDTHELPNSLTWGPDGWLYGLNGVFNQSHVKHRGQEYRFTCALFRINPRPDTTGLWKGTHDFELFCEGTSNPWGVAFDREGSAFVSACVIDHLWHLTETGYYHRQGGPYPPFTWKIGSIVKHKHQKAAYCGIHYFDSAAYPEEYREHLYMGNIHGGCINVDTLSRDGSTYFARPRPDFLTANDAWFMPVVQKTGPDGCLYILDWYDRYHCYQDANRDPKGVDRARGRLYRVRYQDTPRAPRFDLQKESNEQLLVRLHSPNVFFRDMAQRVLAERSTPEVRQLLEQLVRTDSEPRKARMHALWARLGCGPLDSAFLLQLLSHKDAGFRAWGVRAAGNQRCRDPQVCRRIEALAGDPSADVKLQVAIAVGKLEALDAVPLLVRVLNECGNDKLIPHIVWQNLHPRLGQESGKFLALVTSGKDMPNVAALMPRVVERLLAVERPDPVAFATLFGVLTKGKLADAPAAGQCLTLLAERIQSHEVSQEQLSALRPRLEPHLQPILEHGHEHPLHFQAAVLAALWQHPRALQVLREAAQAPATPGQRRVQALAALIAVGDDATLSLARELLTHKPDNPLNLRTAVLEALGRAEHKEIAAVVLAHYPQMEPSLQPKAIELLTQRPAWTLALLSAIEKKAIPASALHVNQVRTLLASPNQDIVKAVRTKWGSVRSERNPDREKLIASMRDTLREHLGDPHRGQRVFKKVCAQCHKIYGEGVDVGPDLTSNGRASYEQLLSNVFDPSLVIGPSYQAQTVILKDGRVLVGLLVEDGKQRVVLKTQGGKQEVLARQDIEEMVESKLSLMPENLEQQINSQELRDLFAFLTLDQPPGSPAAKHIPGTLPVRARQTENPAEYDNLLSQIVPGFSTRHSGVGGVAILTEHLGRRPVLRTHPVNRDTACVLTGTVSVPPDRQTHLLLSVAHDPRGDWQLSVKANGKQLYRGLIAAKTTLNGWADLRIDLTPFAGQSVRLELENQANDWNYEFGYWQRIEVVSSQ